MTPAPSIKEALDYLEAAANWMQRYLDTFGELGDDATQANIDDWHDAVKQCSATFQPSGERREAIALQIWNARLERRGETPVTMETVRSAKERGFDILAMDRPTADAILASGFVQDEAGIRADEREKCAKIAEDRWREWRSSYEDDLDGMDACADIAAAIRSARDGGEG